MTQVTATPRVPGSTPAPKVDWMDFITKQKEAAVASGKNWNDTIGKTIQDAGGTAGMAPPPASAWQTQTAAPVQQQQQQTQTSGIAYEAPRQTATPYAPQAAQPRPDYAALAAARTAAALAQKKSIAATQKTSLDRSFARDNQITADNRQLENAQTNRTLNPFAGKTAFDKGMIGRERTLVDENKSGNLAAQKAGIDDLLAAYETATAEEQVRIADELEFRDKQYNLSLANLTGEINGQQTLEARNSDRNYGLGLAGLTGTINGQKTASQSNADRSFNQSQQQINYAQDPNNPNNQGQLLSNAGQALTNKLNEMKIGNYPAELKQQATLYEQQVKSGQMSIEAAEYNLEQAKDPNSTGNQAKALDLKIKQLEAANLPEKQRLELQQLTKQIAQIGVVHYKPQTANEIEMDKIQLKTAQKQLDILDNKEVKAVAVNPKDSADTYSTMLGDLEDPTITEQEANNLVDQNKPYLTDTDYKNAKKLLIDKY